MDEHLPLNQTSLQQMLDEAAFQQLAHGQAYNHDIRLQRADIDMYSDRLHNAKPISELVKGMSDGQLEATLQTSAKEGLLEQTNNDIPDILLSNNRKPKGERTYGRKKKDPIRSPIDTGRRAAQLTSEISDANGGNGNVLDVEAMEKLYEELESNGIGDRLTTRPLTSAAPCPAPEEGADDYEDGLTADGITIDDPVKVYLKEVGRVPLLSPRRKPSWH